MIQQPQEAARLLPQYIETRLKMWMNSAPVVYSMGVRQMPAKYMPLIAAYKKVAQRGQADLMKEDLREAFDGFKYVERRFSPENYGGFVFDTETFIYAAAMCDNFFEVNMLMTFLYLSNCRSFKEMCVKHLPNGYPDISMLRMLWDMQVSDEPEHQDKINLIDCVNSVNNVYKQLHGAK